MEGLICGILRYFQTQYYGFVSVCPFAMDLAFLLDSSASIRSSNYRIMKEFVNKVIDHFHVSDEGRISNGRAYDVYLLI